MKITAFTILKGILLVVLILFWIPFFTSSVIHSTVSFDVISTQLSTGLDGEVYPLQDVQKVRSYLALDPSAFESIAFYRNDDAMSANEMAVVKSEDSHVLEQFAQAVRTRIDTQKNIYEGYAPAQAALMDEAVVDVQGNYAFYYVGDQSAAMDELFVKSLKGESQ